MKLVLYCDGHWDGIDIVIQYSVSERVAILALSGVLSVQHTPVHDIPDTHDIEVYQTPALASTHAPRSRTIALHKHNTHGIINHHQHADSTRRASLRSISSNSSLVSLVDRGNPLNRLLRHNTTLNHERPQQRPQIHDSSLDPTSRNNSRSFSHRWNHRYLPNQPSTRPLDPNNLLHPLELRNLNSPQHASHVSHEIIPPQLPFQSQYS